MNFVIVGTDHRFQHRDEGLEMILRAWLGTQFIEPLIAIGEEFHDRIGTSSTGMRFASEHGLEWINIDMTTEEKHQAGILAEQRSRPGMFQPNVTYRIPSDDVREDAWVAKLTEKKNGTIIVICGYLHADALIQKLRAKGHAVDQRIYLETVPEIRRYP